MLRTVVRAVLRGDISEMVLMYGNSAEESSKEVTKGKSTSLV
jgi:hypothetical protein